MVQPRRVSSPLENRTSLVFCLHQYMNDEEMLTDGEELIYWIGIVLYFAYIIVWYGGATEI